MLVDSNPEKHGKIVKNHRVVPPPDPGKVRNSLIISPSKHYDEIHNIVRLNYPENKVVSLVSVLQEYGLKIVLLLGDSIRLDYQKEVSKRLQTKKIVTKYPSENCMGSVNMLYRIHEYTELFNKGEDVNLIHWNCGLWDVVRMMGEGWTILSEDIYASTIAKIAIALKRLFPKALQVFAETTAVLEPCEVKSSKGKIIGTRKNEDIKKFNRIARNELSKLDFKIEIDELYNLTKDVSSGMHSDSTHFNTEYGAELLGSTVCNSILSHIIT